MRRWRSANPDKYRESQLRHAESTKRWQLANRDRMREARNRYRKRHAEKLSEASKLYYQKNRERLREKQKADQRKNPKISLAHRRRKYGINEQMLNALRNAQDNRCAVCRTAFPMMTPDRHEFTVDHCHANGKVRGLLCNLCNRAIGAFRDNPKFLRAAIRYLKNPPAFGLNPISTA